MGLLRRSNQERQERERNLIQQDFVAYQESVLEELRSIQNRIRNLIGAGHWLTDGEHKEAVIRSMLRHRLPETMRVSRGFVCFPQQQSASRQLDILITPKFRPVLYKDGELVFVTANSVKAIIEVKTELQPKNSNRGTSLFTALNRFADQLEIIRQHSTKRCWAGLFVYEMGGVNHENLLQTLQQVARGNEERAIDCVSVGENLFVHFWKNGRGEVHSPVNGSVWHSYDIHRLAPAYFVSNIVVHASPDILDDELLAWFPIEGGKETRRHSYIPLNDDTVRHFGEYS